MMKLTINKDSKGGVLAAKLFQKLILKRICFFSKKKLKTNECSKNFKNNFAAKTPLLLSLSSVNRKIT